jgi:hypothetical protein
MATEYRLTLAGETPIADVATRALPGDTDRGEPFDHGLDIDLRSDRGIGVTIWAGRDGYFDAEADWGEHWEWEPSAYVDVTCRVTRDPALHDTAIRAMLDIVARVLATGSEDAALMLDGNYLLLTRTDGVSTKHDRTAWWDHYGWVNEIVPG